MLLPSDESFARTVETEVGAEVSVGDEGIDLERAHRLARTSFGLADHVFHHWLEDLPWTFIRRR